MSRRFLSNQAGVTLIELIVSMVVISVALVGVMSVINYTTLHSADPVLRQQAIAIAEAYMEEITLKNFDDPGVDGETSRALFDDVDDYNNLPDRIVRDSNGVEITTLGGYFVDVVVQGISDWQGVSALKIDVTVTDPAGQIFTLSSYRTDY